MGAASRGGSPAFPNLGGAGAVLEVRHASALGQNLASGLNTGWVANYFMRYGGDVAPLGGVNAFDNGSAGSTPNRGYLAYNGTFWKRSRETNAVVTNTPIDWYFGVCPSPIVTKPPVDLPSAFAVWEVGVTMMLEALPGAAITRDCGLVFIMSPNTSYANCLRAGVAAGNDYAGFGVVFDGLNGDVIWIDKKSGAFGGAPLTESVTLLSAVGALRPVPVKVRFHSATRSAEGRLEVFVDNVLALTRYWGAGTVLPVAADATFSAVLGYFRPIMRTAVPSASNCALLWREEYIRAASNAAFLNG
jgi:hypothetical protein